MAAPPAAACRQVARLRRARGGHRSEVRKRAVLFVAATSEFRFFIDPASLSVGSDGVVRYVLVARSPAGVDNVSFEGMRCTSAEVRTYALGRDGAWTAKPGAWRTIEPRSVQRWHNALYREYFCPQKAPIGSAREGIDALRRGGHPFARGFSGDALKQH